MRGQLTGRIGLFTVALTAFALLGGCGVKVTEDFAGRDPDQVWTALVAVAESPDYDDPHYGRWTVMENEVWTDGEARRIEIFRRLRRTFYQGHDPVGRRQDRAWEFQITVEEGETGPSVVFQARNWAIPGHVWPEAERYFAGVKEILGGMPAEPPSAAPAEPTTAPADAPAPAPAEEQEQPGEPADAPPIDVDDVTDGR